MGHYLGVDIGATNLRAAIGTEDGNIINRLTCPTPRSPTGDEVTDSIIKIIQSLCDDIGITPSDLSAAGLGSVGPLNEGCIVNPANFSGNPERIELVDPLIHFLDTDRIHLESDTTCGVIGERHYADSGSDDMVYVTFSTGIGAGVLSSGTLLTENTGEVGHFTLDSEGSMQCHCGGYGHWEAYAGGKNIPRYASHLQRELDIDTNLPTASAGLTAKKIFDNVGHDELADLVIDRVGQWNTIGIANVIHAFAPSYIAIGGAIAQNNPKQILPPIQQKVQKNLLSDSPEIGLTKVGDDVVLKGALHLAINEDGENDY